jgi:C-terminal processing protease CtpA/Prc
MTNPEQCNAIGQKYFGPVVLITDALCYSTTDIFAAGFQDHEVGTVLGVDDNTGAGGANVWEHRYFVQYVLPGTVYTSLPNGAGMRVAIRRTLRVGRRAGAPVEDLGVNPDKRHYLTKSDLLNSNVDLINAAGKLLKAAGPERSLKVEVQPTSTQVSTVTVESKGMNRFDFYLAERPIQSIDTANGQAVVTIKKPDSSSQMLEIQGFDGTKKVARYRVEV